MAQLSEFIDFCREVSALFLRKFAHRPVRVLDFGVSASTTSGAPLVIRISAVAAACYDRYAPTVVIEWQLRDLGPAGGGGASLGNDGIIQGAAHARNEGAIEASKL